MGCGVSVYDSTPTLRQFKEEYEYLGLTPSHISTMYTNSYAPNASSEGEDMELVRFCTSFKIVKEEHIKVLRIAFGMGQRDEHVAFKDFVYGCWTICSVPSNSKKYLMALFKHFYADVYDPKMKTKKIGLTYKRILELIRDTASNVAVETAKWKKIIAEQQEFNKDRDSVTFDEIDDHYDDNSGVGELPFMYFFFNLQLLLVPTLSKEKWEALEKRRLKMHKEYLEASAFVDFEKNKNFAVIDTSRFSIRLSVWEGKKKKTSKIGEDNRKTASSLKDDDGGSSSSSSSNKKKSSHTPGEGVVRRVTKMLNMQGSKKGSKVVSGDSGSGSGKGERSSGSGKGGGIAGRVKRMSMAVTNAVGGRKQK